MEAWHFIKDDYKLRYSDELVEIGKTYSVGNPDKIELCNHGMHASVCVYDALNYAPGPIICRVKLSGKIVKGDDKVVAEHRKVLWIADMSYALHEFACNEAERALMLVDNPDPRSLAAIKAKRDWLCGKITDVEMDAARDAAIAITCSAAMDAAWAAAWSAARASARATAWSNARAATRDTAWDAARDDAWVTAWSIARDDAWDAAIAAQKLTLNQLAWDHRPKESK